MRILLLCLTLTACELPVNLGKITPDTPHVRYLYTQGTEHVYSVCDPPTIESFLSKSGSLNPPVAIWWKSNSIQWWRTTPEGEYHHGWFKQGVSPPPGDCQTVTLGASTDKTQTQTYRLYFASGGYVQASIKQPKPTS